MSPTSSGFQALWLDAETVAWPEALHTLGARYGLLGHPDVKLTAGTLDPEHLEMDWRTKKQPYLALHLSGQDGRPLERPRVEEILKGPITFQALVGEEVVAQTGGQIAGVLDDLYAEAEQEDLGLIWNEATPTLRIWAPTAESVSLVIWDEPSGNPEIVQATRKPTGVWEVVGEATWEDRQYLWNVRVFAPSVGQVVDNLVTDPYSLGLTVDSKRSVLVNLDQPRWKPEKWGHTRPAPLRTQAQQTIYELHVRDFSIWDQSVPADLRGTYKAFTLANSDGVTALKDLADAGMTTVHLLPTFDIATTSIPEARSEQTLPSLDGVALVPGNLEQLRQMPGWGPASPIQQEAVQKVLDVNGFNWGYDPFHWFTPEGSYASPGNQVGGARTLEYRQMIAAIHQMGLRVAQDVVFNHTAGAGQDDMSVLDKVVPGYYHRLCPLGMVEQSTCCFNVATEHTMAQKMMIDALVTAAIQYHVDGFRFDLMGHHSLENMKNIRAALDALTIENSGVDGASIYLYGEGWDFGEVSPDALFVQASQRHVAGTGIGAFNDRLRDAVLGGTPADSDPRQSQGFGTGLYTDPNREVANTQHPGQQLGHLKECMNAVKVCLAGSLKSYEVPTDWGTIRASDLYFRGQPAAFADNPEESVNYVEAHDNETLFDFLVWKLPTDTPMETRLRMQVLANAVVAYGQSPAFWASGTELLRSKSLDRDSYASSDWFNAIDWTGQWNQFGEGLPMLGSNGNKWDAMRPLLEDPALKPTPDAMDLARRMSLDLLRVRASTPLLTLGDAEAIKKMLKFPNAGANEDLGVIVMSITDPDEGHGSTLPDSEWSRVVVVFNATPIAWTGTVTGMQGVELRLHPVLADGADPVVKAARWDVGRGQAFVPPRTAAVLVG